jgi:hypothetical protein
MQWSSKLSRGISECRQDYLDKFSTMLVHKLDLDLWRQLTVLEDHYNHLRRRKIALDQTKSTANKSEHILPRSIQFKQCCSMICCKYSHSFWYMFRYCVYSQKFKLSPSVSADHLRSKWFKGALHRHW